MRIPVTPVVWKQPGEARVVTFDFASKLNTGDTVTAIASLLAPGLTVTAQLRTGNKVSALLAGGTIDETHRVNCRVTTTQGETLELDVDVEVLDGAN